MTYIEVTPQIFSSLLINEQVIKPYKFEQLETCTKEYYHVLGVNMVKVDSYLTFTSQYYIQDINA